MRKQFSQMTREGESRNKVISMLIAFTLLLGAIGGMGIPCLAEASEETVYYYNDFSDASADNRYWSNRGAGIVDGQFYLYRGSSVLFNPTNQTVSTYAKGIPVDYVGDRPNLKVEYTVTAPVTGMKGGNIASYDSGARALVNTNAGIETMGMYYNNIYPVGYALNKYDLNSFSLGNGTFFAGTSVQNIYSLTFQIKILYSGSENIRTIYINDQFMGTFENKSTYAWNTDEENRFKLAFVNYFTSEDSAHTADYAFKFDNVKISRLEDEMIKVPLTYGENAAVPTGTLSEIWVPSGESALLRVRPADGYSAAVSYNGDVMLEGFDSDVNYITPALQSGDRIVIAANAAETAPAAYTRPYTYQYLKDSANAIVTLGRRPDVAGYTVETYGVLYSRTNSVPTVGGADVKQINGTNSLNSGNYGIELYGAGLVSGDAYYIRAYACYYAEDDTEKANPIYVYGNVITGIID